MDTKTEKTDKTLTVTIKLAVSCCPELAERIMRNPQYLEVYLPLENAKVYHAHAQTSAEVVGIWQAGVEQTVK